MNDTSNFFLEPLEARVAPAVTIMVGDAGNNDPRDQNFTGIAEDLTPTPFISTNSGDANFGTGVEAANVAFLTNTVATSDTYYLRLAKGDKILIHDVGNDYTPFLTVNSGEVMAVFVDINGDKEVDANELTGVALSKGSSISVNGVINGDIVTNYDAVTNNFLAGGSIGTELSTITGVDVDGIQGSIFAGGSINNVRVTGSVVGIFTGLAGAGFGAGNFHLNEADATHVDHNVTFAPALKKAAGSISNVTVGSVTQIEAGIGGLSAAGGSVTNITILSDTNGFTIRAGAGGDGDGTSKGGGVGGSVTNILVKGVVETVPTNDLISIAAGNGGIGDVSGGTGGKGGAVSKIYIGQEKTPANKLIPSQQSLSDSVIILSGTGGNGKIGGAGGALTDIQVSTAVADAALTDEIIVRAGAGGSVNGGLAGSKAGVGGSITSAILQNTLDGATLATISVEAGDGGVAGIFSGAAGGSLSKIKVLGYKVAILAGDGSDGNVVGGAGGSITDAEVLVKDLILANTITIDAGKGGSSVNGSGGKGGALTTLLMENVDVAALNLNSGTQGDGGTGGNGKGGAGGAISKIKVIESGPKVIEGTATIRSGVGGAGSKGGGAGGAITDLTIDAGNLNVIATTGAGGNATVSGAAGTAGSFKTFSVRTIGDVAVVPNSVVLTAGLGGNVLAAAGNAGAGGDIAGVNATATGFVTVQAGAGGTAITGAPGRGGNLTGVKAESINALSGVSLFAGNAVATGGKAAVGGKISGSVIYSGGTLTIQAGNGALGGAGGDISGSAFNGPLNNATQGAGGIVNVIAGAGSSNGAAVGKGGSLLKVTGYASSAATTTLSAGDGGSGTTSGADGGSVTTATISGGGYATGKIVIEAGTGGDAPTGTKPGKGGNVAGITVTGVVAGTIVQSIAAGDGGDAGAVNGKGGLGGSITGVVVNADIGVRSGQDYGVTTMGGLFAGAGGAGGLAAGIAGSVKTVNADMISAIVAGTAAVPQLATSVEGIAINVNPLTHIVQGLNADPTGAYTNYATAGFVGASHLMNPNVADANDYDNGAGVDGVAGTTTPSFAFGAAPLDGLIAAITLKNTKNFTPTAWVTLNNGVLTLVDNSNANLS